MTETLSCPNTAFTIEDVRPRHCVPRAADAVPAPPRQARVLRFAALTVVGAPTNLVLYALLLQFTPVSAALATIVAALCVIIPKFLVSKYWVWKQRSGDRLRREIVVYVMVTLTSLGFATAVGWAFEANGATNAVLVVANLGAFTLMWVMRFVVLDRFGFVSAGSATPQAAA